MDIHETTHEDLDSLSKSAADLAAEIAAGLVGLDRLVERLMISLLTGGHLLIEGQPGLAKTRAVKLLSAGLEGSFSRVQCTPDLMPGDLTGTQVFHPESSAFEFIPGPVFHSLLLVDEINRAPPKVQSALLEAMAENQVTVGSQTRGLPADLFGCCNTKLHRTRGNLPLAGGPARPVPDACDGVLARSGHRTCHTGSG